LITNQFYPFTTNKELKKMNLLEQTVREALIERTAKETQEMLEQPKYSAMLRALTTRIVDSVADSMKEIDPEAAEEISTQIKAQIQGSDFIKQSAYQSARGTYMSSGQFEELLNTTYEQMREMDVEEKAIEEFREANNLLIKNQTKIDQIVENLVEVAERDGIEQATTKEARNAAIRSVFPTAEDYLSTQKEAMEMVSDYFNKVQSAMMQDGEIGQVMGAVFGGMQKAIKESQGLIADARTETTYKQIKEIYGK
jgi:hypothetical protein